MRTRRCLCGLIAALIAAALLAGCQERKHREIRVKHEQQEGEVQPVSPGEMVVE